MGSISKQADGINVFARRIGRTLAASIAAPSFVGGALSKVFIAMAETEKRIVQMQMLNPPFPWGTLEHDIYLLGIPIDVIPETAKALREFDDPKEACNKLAESVTANGFGVRDLTMFVSRDMERREREGKWHRQLAGLMENHKPPSLQ